jgi:thiol-disulfide isomerase/thioredoxin
LPGPIVPEPLPLPAQRIYKGESIEVFDVLQGGRSSTTDAWTGRIQLAPDKTLSFAAELDLRAKPPFGFFVVGDERIPIPEVSLVGTALVLNFSEYGAEMRGVLEGTSWTGQYLRHRADGTKSFDFSATKGNDTNPGSDDSGMPMGSFKVRFEDETEKTAATSARFWKKDRAVFGTFIAPDGDYGLFEGITANGGDASFHRFTGWQAMRLDLHSKGNRWTGTLDAASNPKPRNFTLEPSPDPLVVRETRMKNPAAAFEFSCQSSAGLEIRNTDLQFRGKAMIVDIMGTWCHNCLDEAPVLQQLKRRYGENLEIVGLSFELTNDAPLAVKNLGLFKERFALTYPLLFCGDLDEANIDAQLRRQLDNFFAYPTSLFIEATGKVRTIHSGFKGPGTGDEVQRQVALFHELADAIVSGGER